MDKGRTLYDILEVPPTASLDEIKKAYRRLAMQWHPDRNLKKQKQAELRFKEISHAYKVLSEQARRHQYDETLAADADVRTFDKDESSDDLSNTFLAMVLDIAFEMAVQGYSEREIYQRLVEEGCPQRIAAVVARRAAGGQGNGIRIDLSSRKLVLAAAGMLFLAVAAAFMLVDDEEEAPYAPSSQPAVLAAPQLPKNPRVPKTDGAMLPGPLPEDKALPNSGLAQMQWNMPATLTGEVMSDTYMDCCLGGLPTKSVYHYLLLDSPIEMKGDANLQMPPPLQSVTKVQLSADIFDLMEASDSQHATVTCRDLRYGGSGHYALPVFCEVDHIGEYRKLIVTEKNEAELEGMNAYELSILPGMWFSRKVAYLNQELNEEFLRGLKVSGKVVRMPHFIYGGGCSIDGCEAGSSAFVIDTRTRELSSIHGKKGKTQWARGFLANGIPQQLCADLAKLEAIPREVFFCPHAAH